MKRYFTLFAFFSFSLLCMPKTYGQTNSGQDEIIWTEEGTGNVGTKKTPDSISTNNKKSEALFDEEESDSELLRFLKTNENSDTIEIIDVEDFDENDENLTTDDASAIGKRPANGKIDNTNAASDKGDIILFDENDESLTEAELEERKKASNLINRIETSSKTDTIAAYVKRIATATSGNYVPFDDRVSFRDTIIVNPIFMPFVFDGKVLPDDYQLYDADLYKKQYDFSFQYTIEEDDLFKDQKIVKKIHHDLNNYVTQNHPTTIKYSKRDLPNDIPVAVAITKPSLITRMLEIEETPVVSSGSPEQFVPKIKYWIVKGSSSIQFSQNYLSPNWAAGGNSSVNLISVNELTANYDNKKRFIFNNYLLYRLSFTNAQGDTLRSIRIGEDIFRYKPSIGLKAAKNNKWYYTISGSLETQLFKNYRINSNEINTAFLAPLVANVGIGMNFSTTKTFPENKYKSIAVAAKLLPLSITYKYTNRPELNLVGYGFKPDQRSFYNVGTTVDLNLICNFTRFIKWDSKLYLFTTYKKVDMYFENTFDFAINRYFSTRVYLNMKYNSESNKYVKATDKDKNYPNTRLQLNELLSFGFSYNW